MDEFEVTPQDCQRWAAGLQESVASSPGDSEENRMKILCAYLLYCFADTIADELPAGAGVQMPDPKDLN